MKKLIHSFLIFSLLTLSCGKVEQESNHTEENSGFRQEALKKFSSRMLDINNRIDERTDSVGKGYNSITGLIGERCLENEKAVFRLEPTSRVEYEENLSSQDLLNKLGIGVNANIPLEASGVPITLSPEMRYSREASSSSLARTVNVTVEFFKGYNELVKIDPNSEYKLKDIHYKSLIENSANFFNVCGDEIIVKQKAKALLLITAKFIFSNSKTKSEFEAAMGASIPNPFNFGGTSDSKSDANTSSDNDKKEDASKEKSESKINTVVNSLKDKLSPKSGGSSGGMLPEVKIKFSNLSQDTRKNIMIVLKATQLGGDPSKLPTLLGASCNLSDPGICDTLFSNIQKYASQDFPDQLKETIDKKDENNKFYLGDTEKALYGSRTILSPDGKNISDSIIKYTDGSIEFTAFKIKVRTDVKTSFQNYLRAQDIATSKSFNLLANDEIKLVKNTQDLSENNLTGLFRFVNKCYADIKSCQSEYQSKRSLFYTDYDKAFDDIRAWTLIASDSANWQPVRYSFLGYWTSDRITGYFFKTSSLRGYNSFFIKYLDKDRNKITSAKYDGISLSTSFRCYSRFLDATGHKWLHEVEPNFIMQVSENIVTSCGSSNAFACTFNSNLSKLGHFTLQIWAE